MTDDRESRGRPEKGPAGEPVEVDSAQLRAFLESDLHGDQADPDFRERLRRTLWSLVRRLYPGTRAKHEN